MLEESPPSESIAQEMEPQTPSVDPPFAEPPAVDWLIPTERLEPIEHFDKTAEAFLLWINQFQPNSIHMEASSEQWRAIITPATASIVNAGAGSGKTATMVFRVMALNQLYQVPWSEIHVLTFGKKASEEFADRLQKAAVNFHQYLHGPDALIDAKQLPPESCVSTFSSSIFRMWRTLHPGEESSELFNFLGHEESDDALSLSPPQRELLKAVHLAELVNPDYRVDFQRLIEDLLTLKALEPSKQHLEHYAQWTRTLAEAIAYRAQVSQHARTRHLMAQLQDHGFTVSDAPNDCAFTVYSPVDRQKTDTLWSTLRVNDRLYVHLEHPNGHAMNRKWPEIITQWAREFGEHRWLSNAMFTKDHQLKDEALYALSIAANQGNRPWEDEVVAGLGITDQGRVSRTPYYETLYGELSFWMSLGLDPEPVGEALGKDLGLSERDRAQCRMIQRFTRGFRERLRKEHLLLSSDQTTEVCAALEDPADMSMLRTVVRGFSHLIVDEFQDVSPEFVRFLQALLRSNRATASSLMCVGDDWQSIYGWRGSNPNYLVQFDQYFTAPDVQTFRLETCYRSSQSILDAGKAIIEGIPIDPEPHRTTKQTVSASLSRRARWQATIHTVEMSDPGQIASVLNGVIPLIAAIMVERKRLTENAIPTDLVKPEITLYLLYRTNDLRGVHSRAKFTHRLREELHSRWPDHTFLIQPSTIHQAKGLETDIAIIFGDSTNRPQPKVRNAVWAYANMPFTYDQVMADESHRLGYVAVTRARWGVIWLVPSRGNFVVYSRLKTALQQWARAEDQALLRHKLEEHAQQTQASEIVTSSDHPK